MFMICMYIWKIHLFVVPVPVSLCVVVIVIVGCYGWNTTWHDPHRLTAEDAPGVDLQPHSTQACCAGDPKINGWNLQSSPMKRKEHDLNQTSRELCSMLIFRGVNCRFQKLTCVEVAFGDSKRVTGFCCFCWWGVSATKLESLFFFFKVTLEKHQHVRKDSSVTWIVENTTTLLECMWFFGAHEDDHSMYRNTEIPWGNQYEQTTELSLLVTLLTVVRFCDSMIL